MQVTDELRVVVEAEVARAIENFKKLEGGIDGAEKKTKSFGDALDSVSKKSLVISGVLGAAGVAAVKFAGENEKLKLSLKNMLGSADEASAVFEEWRRLGSSPGLSPNEVFELGGAMVNMGHDTAYATKTMQMLGNVAAGTGKSFGAVSGAFEHVRAAGKLTSRDLVSFQQQGIPIIKQLAKELNTSEDGIRRMVAQGKIGFPEIEKAFRGMTGPGGQFAGIMDELSGTVLAKFSTATDEAKQALASFGEMMLPMATELLDGATSILRGITDMDEGTKRFVLGMGGVVAVSGPAINAIKGVSKAMKLAMANPYILAIGGVIAGTAVLVGLVSKMGSQIDQAHKDYDANIKKITKGNQELLRSAASFEEVGRRIRGLTRDMYEAARETGNFDAAETAAARVTVLYTRIDNLRERATGESEHLMLRVRQLTETLEMPVDPGITSWLDGFATEAAKVNEALVSLRSEGWADLSGYLEMTPGWAEAVASQSSEAMLNILRNISGGSRQTRAEIERIQNEIYELSSGMTIRPPGGGDAATAEAKKSWQEWFGEITKIDPERFGSSGAKAAELYLAEFSRSLGAGKTVSAALGEEFNIAEALRGQQADIQKTLVELLSINPDDIDDPFKIYSRSIEPLAAQFRRLGEEINAAEYAKQIKDLQKKIDDFGKSEADLAYDAAKANGALVEQADKIKSLMNECTRTEIIDDYRRRIEELTVSQRDLAIAAFEAAGGVGDELEEFKRLYDQLERLNSGFISLEQKISDSLYSAMEHMKKFKAESAVAIADLAAQFASLNISASLNGFEEFGRAMGEGKNAAESMRNALTAMSLEILNALPNLFLQAGLQLIAQGQWPLGLGFIAAAGSTALIKGYVGGRVEAEQSAARNAHGNIFGETGIQAFARGGSFTNQIVSGPTLFKFARGTGLMGEAGPEAVMPLRRMANGDLGVRSEGGGANVTVNIINNSGAEVKQEEYEDGDGNKQYDIYIGEMINRHLASGKADRVMGGRYNIRAAGV